MGEPGYVAFLALLLPSITAGMVLVRRYEARNRIPDPSACGGAAKEAPEAEAGAETAAAAAARRRAGGVAYFPNDNGTRASCFPK